VHIFQRNRVTDHEGYHVSYNPSPRDYGCDTTALVLGDHAIFLILKGNHYDALNQAPSMQAAVDYFIDHADLAHDYGDHKHLRNYNHPFSVPKHADILLGADNIERILNATATV